MLTTLDMLGATTRKTDTTKVHLEMNTDKGRVVQYIKCRVDKGTEPIGVIDNKLSKREREREKNTEHSRVESSVSCVSSTTVEVVNLYPHLQINSTCTGTNLYPHLQNTLLYPDDF